MIRDRYRIKKSLLLTNVWIIVQAHTLARYICSDTFQFGTIGENHRATGHIRGQLLYQSAGKHVRLLQEDPLKAIQIMKLASVSVLP